MRLLVATMGASVLAHPVSAESARAAVAANFTAVAETLAADFSARTGHTVELSFGATGGLYTQISQGAPFDVFLAADAERPRRAIEEGFAIDGTTFTYAIGRIALCGSALGGDAARAALEAGAYEKLAIANPETAPYGAAALEVIEHLGLTAEALPRLVTGENVSQTLQFVETTNAELGFVALSQVQTRAQGACWVVPPELHSPILQDAVLLKQASENVAAREFLVYLRAPEAIAIIAGAGYSTP